MLYYCNQIQSLLFGCLTFLVVTTVVNAEGRVFVLDLKVFQGFRQAERECSSQNARLASLEELRQAVADCFFSHCTSGWLYGGTVGTTVCKTEGISLKPVEVKIANATEETTQLSAFCVKEKALACGDPPSIPNARLQDQSGFEMGDELLYTCRPGYVMPSGRTAFSLLCDSCGEWYGAVQICVKDAAETHVDYEDKFEDSFEEVDHDHDSQEDAFVDASQVVKRISQQQETRFWVNSEEDRQDHRKVHNMRVNVINNSRTFERTVDEVAKTEEDTFTAHPKFEHDRTKSTAAVTEGPVSLLSQKHMFWFPSEAFQEEVPAITSDSVTQATPRVSGERSEESKDHESQERLENKDPVDDDDDDHHHHHHHDRDDHDHHDHRDRDDYDDRHDHDHYHDDHHDRDDHDDRHDHDHDDHHDRDGDDHDDHHDRDRHDHDDHHDHHDHDDHDDDKLDRSDDHDDEQDIHEDPGNERDDSDDHDDRSHDDLDILEHDHTDDPDDPDSRQVEDLDDNVRRQSQYDDLDRPDRNKDDNDDQDDHYDMGENEDGRDDRDDAYDDHPSREHHEDDHGDNDQEHPVDSEEHRENDDHDDGEKDYDHDQYGIHHDHEDKDKERYDDHDSHEDDDGHRHLIISVASERHPNNTQREAGRKSSKDKTWLDGYPVDLFNRENGDSTKGHTVTSVVKTTDKSNKSNDVEVRKRVSHISLSNDDISHTIAPKSDQGVGKKGLPGFRTPVGSSDHSEHSNSPSHSDTLDYDTQQVAPTHSWLDDLTNHPFLDHGLAPPVHDVNTFPGVIEEHSLVNLPGEMGEIEGEKRKSVCVGEDCPPHPPSSTSQGAKVAAIIVAVCAVATAAIIGVWCYRRKQQKSSQYEMNGKAQSQSRQDHQIEMQQKV